MLFPFKTLQYIRSPAVMGIVIGVTCVGVPPNTMAAAGVPVVALILISIVPVGVVPAPVKVKRVIMPEIGATAGNVLEAAIFSVSKNPLFTELAVCAKMATSVALVDPASLVWVLSHVPLAVALLVHITL